MKTTVEIPDELFRRAKATAALRGRKFKDLVEEGLRRVVETPDTAAEADSVPGQARNLHELLLSYCGIVDSGVTDLSTNPKYMEDFGSDSMGNR